MIEPGSVFIDSNVLIYALAERSALHGQATARLCDLGESGRTLCLSPQVLREVIVCLAQPGMMDYPLDPQQALQAVEELEKGFEVLDDGNAVRLDLHRLVRTYDVRGKQVHDANIVATMLRHGVESILTHNVKHFRRYASVIQVLPLI